jgi:hypothetical protein
VISEPEAVLQLFESLSPSWHRAIELGIERARACFEESGKPIEAHHFASTVRLHARWYFETVGQSVGIQLKDLPNNGLSFVYQGFDVRVWKSNRGAVPSAGRSLSRQGFMHQLTLGLTLEDGLPMVTHTNLILLWHLDSSHAFHHLSLACPKSAGDGPDSPELYWEIDIPYPAETMRPADDDQAEDIDDLPIEPLEFPEDGIEEAG